MFVIVPRKQCKNYVLCNLFTNCAYNITLSSWELLETSVFWYSGNGLSEGALK